MHFCGERCGWASCHERPSIHPAHHLCMWALFIHVSWKLHAKDWVTNSRTHCPPCLDGGLYRSCIESSAASFDSWEKPIPLSFDFIDSFSLWKVFNSGEWRQAPWQPQQPWAWSQLIFDKTTQDWVILGTDEQLTTFFIRFAFKLSKENARGVSLSLRKLGDKYSSFSIISQLSENELHLRLSAGLAAINLLDKNLLIFGSVSGESLITLVISCTSDWLKKTAYFSSGLAPTAKINGGRDYEVCINKTLSVK